MAATIYEPLPTAHLKSCTVDFDSRPDKKAVNLVQYDKTIPVLCVSLKKGGTEYKVPSDADVNIRMDKRDGYHVYNPALGVNAERTIAYFAVTPQMSTGWGDYYPIVEITVGGGIAGSAPIWLHFDRNPLPENAIISSDEYKTIQQLLEDVTVVKAATEQIKAQTEAVRDQAKGFADNAKNSADKAQTLVDGMPSDYSQAMKDIGTLKNQMQRAYPDDSTIGENPWSSKHIIDMLCPPLEESGNPVACYPVAGYPLGVKASWEPVQEGSGTPSPENIRPIKGRDSVTVERCGENLLNIAAFSLDVDKNNRTYTVKVQQIIPSGKYILKLTHTNPNSGLGVQLFMRDGNKVSTASEKIFKLDGILDRIYFYISNTSGNADSIKDIMLIPSTATVPIYTPYIGQTNALTLPETVYGGEAYAESNEGQKTWKMLTLNGTEEWQKVKTVPYPYLVADILHLGNVTLTYLAAKCTAFPLADVNANNNENGFNGWKNHLYIRWASLSTVDALKSYLAAQYAAGTPVQVCYKLAEPVPFTATGAQPLPALAGLNTVLTDADSATVTGRADPIKRITDLEDAVASQT